MINKICGPAILYLGFSLIHIIIDAFHGKYNNVLVEVIISAIFTVFLQLLCMNGMTIVSWIIVFIPFILFTYITGIILYVFGLKPKPENQKYNILKDNTNCNSSMYGCCPDYKTPKKDPKGSNCVDQVGGCISTQYGCCPNSTLARHDEAGSNCPPYDSRHHDDHHDHHHHHHDSHDKNNNNKNKINIGEHKHYNILGKVKKENEKFSIVKPYSKDGYSNL